MSAGEWTRASWENAETRAWGVKWVAPLSATDTTEYSHRGMWRSLVAHLTGGQGVAGSNPVIST